MMEMETENLLNEDLKINLWTAMATELTTIATYLYAYWSIKPLDDGGSPAGVMAAQTIMSVIVEEMLHMGLVSNLLNALGGTPNITEPPYLPKYPCKLLRSPKKEWGCEVYLKRLSRESLKNFLKIELPAWDAPDEPTIAKFYERDIGEKLPKEKNEYKFGRQLPNRDNPGVGKLISVSSHDEAEQAITLIIDQGEGLTKDKYDDDEHELAHYWRFKEVEQAIENRKLDLRKDVYKVVDNPHQHLCKYNLKQKKANYAFNSVYSQLLDELQQTLSSDSPEVFFKSTRLMNELGRLAAVLRNTGHVFGTMCCLPGPTFDYIPENERVSI